MKTNFYEILKELVNSKKIIITINENESFTLTSSTIDEFENFMEKNLKNTYYPIKLDLHIEILSVGNKSKAYFPHNDSPIKIVSQ